MRVRRTIRQRTTEEEVSTMNIENGDRIWRNRAGQKHRIDGPAVEKENGDREWWENGQRHRVGGPAVERLNRSREWWENGQRHRVDGPAIEWEDGGREWWENDQLHRIDGPAVEWADGSREWYEKGRQHRIGGPAVEWADGGREWWENGQKHRIDGPAVERADGTKKWFFRGKKHRIGGPAVQRPDGSEEWWENGIKQERSQPISKVRLQVPVNEEEKCDKVFDIEEDKREYITLNLGDLLRECNIVENSRVDGDYVKNVLINTRLRFVLEKNINIQTETGREIRDAISHRKDLGMYIPQADTSQSKLKITYKDQPGVDYGGMSRQFIAGLMKSISTTMFDVVAMESEDYLKVCESSPLNIKIEPPRYYISRKTDVELRRELHLDDTQKISEVYELAGAVFAYSVLNEIPFNIPLSRVLLKKMFQGSDMNSEEEFITTKEAVTHYILDTGKVLNKEFDFPGLDPEDIEVYSEQKEDSLVDAAKKTYKINRRLISFLQGFEKVGDVLHEEKFTVNELNSLIYKAGITREDMEEFLSRVIFENLTWDQIAKIKEVILDLTPDHYAQLLGWWSGVPAIIRSKKYTIIGRTGNLDYQFNAHTCFFGFDVNTSYIFDPEFGSYLREEIKLQRTTVV